MSEKKAETMTLWLTRDGGNHLRLVRMPRRRGETMSEDGGPSEQAKLREIFAAAIVTGQFADAAGGTPWPVDDVLSKADWFAIEALKWRKHDRQNAERTNEDDYRPVPGRDVGTIPTQYVNTGTGKPAACDAELQAGAEAMEGEYDEAAKE